MSGSKQSSATNKSSFSLRQLLGDTLWYGFADFIPKGINFALLPIMTRFLDPLDYGILAIVQIVAAFGETLFLIGTRSSFARYYAGAYEADAKLVVSSTIQLQVLTQTALGAALLLMFLPQGMPLAFGADGPSFIPYGLGALGLSVFYIVSNVPLMKARMDNQPQFYFFFRVGSFIVSVIGVLYFVVVREQGAWGSVKGQLIGAFISAVAILWIYRRFLVVNRFDRKLVKKSLGYGAPIFAGDISAWAFRISDRVFIQRFRTADTLGMYHVAYNFTLPMDFFINSINFAWMPRMFREALEHKNYEGITHNSMRIYAIVLLVLAGYMALVKPIFVLMTAPKFHIAYKILQILLFYFVTRIIFCLASHFLAVKDRTKELAKITLTSGIVQFSLNLFLIPFGGARGAALSVVLAGVFRAIHIMHHVKKVWPQKLPTGDIVLSTVSFTMVGVFVYLLDLMTESAFDGFSLVAKIGAVSLLYCLFVSRGLVPWIFRKRQA